MKTTNAEIIDDFCRHYCIVCQRKIMVVCGTPVIHIGGCCCGVDDAENKMMYIRTVKCHFQCYIRKKGMIKTMLKFKDIKRTIEGDTHGRHTGNDTERNGRIPKGRK